MSDAEIHALREQAFKLSCDDQYKLAFFIAENVGYVLAPERGFTDEPTLDERVAKLEALVSGSLRVSAGHWRAKYREIFNENKRLSASLERLCGGISEENLHAETPVSTARQPRDD